MGYYSTVFLLGSNLITAILVSICHHCIYMSSEYNQRLVLYNWVPLIYTCSLNVYPPPPERERDHFLSQSWGWGIRTCSCSFPWVPCWYMIWGF
jgi:hypothetical protein